MGMGGGGQGIVGVGIHFMSLLMYRCLDQPVYSTLQSVQCLDLMFCRCFFFRIIEQLSLFNCAPNRTSTSNLPFCNCIISFLKISLSNGYIIILIRLQPDIQVYLCHLCGMLSIAMTKNYKPTVTSKSLFSN